MVARPGLPSQAILTRSPNQHAHHCTTQGAPAAACINWLPWYELPVSLLQLVAKSISCLLQLTARGMHSGNLRQCCVELKCSPRLLADASSSQFPGDLELLYASFPPSTSCDSCWISFALNLVLAPDHCYIRRHATFIR